MFGVEGSFCFQMPRSLHFGGHLVVYHLVLDAGSSVVPGEEIQGLYWQMECEVVGVPGVVVYCPANHQNPNRQVELEGIGRGSVLRISSKDDREC